MSTLSRILLDRVAASPAERAWSSFEDGAWRDYTWADFERGARRFGLGLVALGLQRGDVVAVLGETCATWALCDIGAIGAGGVTVGLYPTLPPRGTGSMQYVLDHSEARVLVVDGAETLRTKIAPILGDLPRLQHIVVWACDADARGLDPRVRSLADVLALGDELHATRPSAWRQACELARPDDLALLIYTSGTTGHPKGVMLTHGNVWAQTDAFDRIVPRRDGDSGVAFLPMAHAAERCVGFYNRLRHGTPVHYARSIETLVEDLGVARPTLFGSVPRIFEKIHARVRGEMARLEPAARAMAEQVFEAGVAAARARRRGEPVDPQTAAMAGVFDRHVGARVRDRLGGRCTRLVSGAAPIAVEILELFDACGMTTFEVYGLTETTGLLTANTEEALRFGTVGRAIPGVELRIASDGEVLARGPNVFKGYFKDPAATAECMDGEWFRTGDIGALDAEGFLTITDRKKNILITAGGKNITPSNVEGEVKRDPLVSYCHLHADRRPYPVALVCLDPERLAALAAERGLPGRTAAELHEHPTVRERVQQAIDAANGRLARFEQIKRFSILPRELSIEGGELTPTLKVKRREVDRLHAAVLESMYEA